MEKPPWRLNRQWGRCDRNAAKNKRSAPRDVSVIPHLRISVPHLLVRRRLFGMIDDESLYCSLGRYQF